VGLEIGMSLNSNKEKIAIDGGTIVSPSKLIHEGLVLIEEGQIKLVVSKKDHKIPSDYEIIDANNMLVLPGFIDLHVNGGGGSDVMDGSYDSINTMAIAHAKHGTTAILPTTISAPDDVISGGLRAIASAMQKGTQGAKILGAHLEGPFLASQKSGAHNPKYLQPLSVKKLDEYFEASNQTIRIVTFSPELEGSTAFIEKIKSMKAIASIGHSDATYDITIKAIKDGITHASHVFNGMRGMDGKEPGTVGAVLLSNGVWAEVIADGFHVHPGMISILLKTKGIEKTVLVTDAMKAAASSMQSCELFGVEITIRNGRTYTKDGHLAGSVLTLEKAVKNVYEWAGLPLCAVVKMASLNPASELGIEERKGSIEVGKDADIVIASKDLAIRNVLIEGKSLLEIS